jgi:hypothetical protein
MKDSAKKDDKSPMKEKAYMKELRRLQAELCRLQEWVKATGQRIIVVLEGRDAALDRFAVIPDAVRAGQPDDRLHQRQGVLATVVDFARKQVLSLFGTLSFRDIDGRT